MTGIVNSTGARSGVIGATTFNGAIGSSATGLTGIKVVDQWRIYQDYGATTGQELNSYWTRADNDKMGDGTNALIGGSTKMTESSGVWKFPLTGIWHVYVKITMLPTGGSVNPYGSIQVSANNAGSFSDGELISAGSWAVSVNASLYMNAIFDIDNVANSGSDGVCVKFSFGGGSGSNLLTVQGASTEWYSGATFTRLGDT